MVNNWKDAYSLALWELNETKKRKRILIYNIFAAIFLTVALCMLMNSYFNNNDYNQETLFILVFLLSTTWMKPKEFQNLFIKPKLLTSPILVMQKHLPINEEAIIKSRLIIYLIYSIPTQLFMLLGLYAFSDLHVMLNIGTFIPFIIFWISLSVLFGSFYIRIDIRMKATNVGFMLYGVLYYFILNVVLTILKVKTNYGLIDGSIYLANSWPILTTIVPIFVIMIGVRFRLRRLKRHLEQTDY